MTQEEKQLLLQDLCGRLAYGVMCQVDDGAEGLNDGKLVEIDISKELVRFDADYYWDAYIDDIKPYLRPMSSMTEEEREDFWKNVLDIDWRELEFDEEPDEVPFPFTENDCGFYLDFIYLADLFAVIDWLNKHHFDYRGLIQKGLAISTKEFNPYKD